MGRKRLYDVNSRCVIEWCGRRPVAKGLCPLHYERQRKTGDPLTRRTRGRPVSDRVCSVEDCGRKHRANGFCALHNRRVRTHGSPFIVLTRGAAKKD